MDTPPRLSVVIPAYNEERRLPSTLAEVLGYLGRQSYAWEVIVVVDGSTDGTARIAREAGVRVIDSRPNRGKGYAVRQGLLAATGALRLFMDADNSTTIEQVERFWPWIDEGGDVAIGSRAADGADVPVRQAWYKERLGRLGNLYIRVMAVPGVRDTQCGFKAMTARAAQAVLPRLSIDGWGFDVELLAVARRLGFRIREFPICWKNSPESKVRPLDYLRVMGEVTKVRLRILRGAYGPPAPPPFLDKPQGDR